MALQEDFDIRTELGAPPPCYVRKVPRALICGDKNDPTELRMQHIRADVLSVDGGLLSVFYVSNAQDVIRAVCALNFARTAGANVLEMCLLAFTPDELSNVAKVQTADTFKCHWAQRNHWNLTLTDEDQIRVAEFLAKQKRNAKRFSQNKMKAAWNAGGEVGCRSVPSDSNRR
jgi:hypothetical protein